jgi:Domain of unknown function (DUF4357)
MTRVVKLVFIDNDPAKRVVCDESNRTARVYKIPRVMLDESKNRKELQQPAVYLLIGENEQEPDRPLVYVGESDDGLTRINQHEVGFVKFAWKLALVIIAQDAALNKAHVKYIENRWYELLRRIDSVALNQLTPQTSSLNESEQAIADDFSATAQFLIGALGYRFFEPSTRLIEKTAATLPIPRFVFNAVLARNIVAYGRPTEIGFVVEKGSLVDVTEKPAGLVYWKPVQDELLKQQIIGIVDGRMQFLADWTTSSPSRAAGAVYGGSRNGQLEWKSEATGETFREWEAKNTLS